MNHCFSSTLGTDALKWEEILIGFIQNEGRKTLTGQPSINVSDGNRPNSSVFFTNSNKKGPCKERLNFLGYFSRGHVIYKCSQDFKCICLVMNLYCVQDVARSCTCWTRGRSFRKRTQIFVNNIFRDQIWFHSIRKWYSSGDA